MRKSHVFVAGLCILAIVLIVRLIWVAAHTECGWTLLKQQWLDATVGLVSRRTVPIYMQEPADQADFWLKEAKRITDADPENAELAMGAALVLDSLSITVENYYKPSVSEDHEAENIEKECTDRCLALGAKAMKLEPDEQSWRRLSALMLVPENCFYYMIFLPPRDSKWINILEKYKNLDAKNALYDYLVAAFLWHNSIVDENSDRQNKNTITDPEKYDMALEYFQKGQKLDYCFTTDDENRALISFLKQAESLSGTQEYH